MDKYIKKLLKIPELVLAAALITLMLKALSYIAYKFEGELSAFEEAVKLFYKYPQSVGAIFAFFSATILFLSLTFIVHPSDIGDKARKSVLIPSFHIVEHMIALALGALIAWAIIDTVSADMPVEFFFSSIGKLLLASVILGGVASICSLLAEFLRADFDKCVNMLGNYRFIILLIIGAILISAVLQDNVWNYKPLI